MNDSNFCTNCGQELVQGDLFCRNCGRKVTSGKKAEDITKTTNIQPPFPQVQPQTFRQDKATNQLQPQKKKGFLPVILVVTFLFLLIIAAVGIFAYKYYASKKSGTVNEVNTLTEKEVNKEPPVSTGQTTTVTDTSKDNIQKKEAIEENTDLNNASDVTGDSEPDTEHDAKYFPGKYPEGSKIYLDESDLIVYYGKDELKIMRNEIFARHGYIFQTDDMRSYFAKQSWYKPERTNVDNLLSKIEKKNVLTIKSAEKTK